VAEVKRKVYLVLLAAIVLAIAGFGSYGLALEAPLRSIGPAYLLTIVAVIIAWYVVWVLIVTEGIKRAGITGRPVRFTTRIRVISLSSMAVAICAGTYFLANQSIPAFVALLAAAPVAILGLNVLMAVRACSRANPA
jgi:hypothetical protein